MSATQVSSLAAVIEQVACGDRDAFATLYDATAPRAFGVALRVLHDPALAEQVTEEAMLEMWRTAPSYDADDGSSVEMWAISIVYRRVADHARRERDRTAAAPLG